VWVLTGPMTFSAAEEFAYNLKAHKRATLVGTVTRGGAHPTALLPLAATLALAVPYARSINPVTGTNWEAVGVEPDVAVPAEQAFDHAYRLGAGARPAHHDVADRAHTGGGGPRRVLAWASVRE
jgi:C-terminal processing protease CtpA/Prc